MTNRIKAAAMSLALLVAPGVGSAQTFTTTATVNTPDTGNYGQPLTFTANGSSLQLRVTAWQSNQSTNAITSAYLGDYTPGLGVTGINDQLGKNGYHQIDNADGYTDFVLLQFSAPVVLKSLYLNSFSLGGASTLDNDLAFYAANIPTAAWNSPIDLSKYSTVPSLWTTVSGNGGDGSVSTGASLASSEWLVGAAFNSGNKDGFKIASITVGAVPEPGSWALMILGVGMVGFALRRRPAPAAVTADAAV